MFDNSKQKQTKKFNMTIIVFYVTIVVFYVTTVILYGAAGEPPERFSTKMTKDY